MRVIFFIKSLSFGGKERRLLELVRYFKKDSEIDCILILLENKIQFHDVQNIFSEIIFLNDKYKKRDISVFYKLFKISKSKNIDIIHSWGLMESFYCIPSKLFLKTKLITANIADAIPRKYKFNLESFLLKSVFLFSDIILSNSYAGLNAYKIKSNKSRVVYNGYNFDRLKSIKINNNQLDKYKIENKEIILMVASFNKYKDYDLFINVAKKFISSNTIFISIGDGEDFNYYKLKAINEKINNIIFVGSTNDIDDFINISTICVLFSNYEGISNSIIEYMSHKKAVIATSKGGTNELILNENTGYIIQSKDINQICDTINLLLLNPQKRNLLGLNGYKRIEQKFSIDTMSKKIINIYKELI